MNWTHSQDVGARADTSRTGAELATYLSVLLALASVLTSLIVTADHRQWGLAAAWSAALIIPAITLYVFANTRHYDPPIATRTFRPFDELLAKDIWPRDPEVQKLRLALAQTSEITLVVGASGVGKSVLLKTVLPDAIGRTVDTDYHYISSYGPAHELAEAAPGEKQILVLDQFEQHLAWLRNRSAARRETAQTWLRDLLKRRIETDKTSVVISVRSEWYWDLRFLEDLLPPLPDVVEVTPPPATATSPARRKIVDQFVTALELDDEQPAEPIVDTLEQDGALLPLEVQIVGATLERAHKAGEKVDARYLTATLGGVSSAINTFFDDVLKGAQLPPSKMGRWQLLPRDNSHVALKVLCALSVRTRFRQRERLDDLLEALFEDRHRVTAALDYLVQQKIIMKVRSGYELAHDYLAEIFHQKSAAELDPTDRDNIEFHIEASHEQNNIVMPRQQREAQRNSSWALITIIVLSVVMTARLLYFGIDWYVIGGGPNPQPLIGGALLDETYLPIYLAHLGWAIYLGLFYHRIFRYLDEDGPARALSIATVAVIPPLAVAAMLIPSVWILSIAGCGFVVGVKMLSLGRTKRVNAAARARMANMGQITTVNMIMAGLVGAVVLGLSLVVVHGESGARFWTIAMIMWSIVLVFACLALVSAHVGQRAAALMLGLLARPVVPAPTSHNDR
jgi:hypothetical protein